MKGKIKYPVGPCAKIRAQINTIKALKNLSSISRDRKILFFGLDPYIDSPFFHGVEPINNKVFEHVPLKGYFIPTYEAEIDKIKHYFSNSKLIPEQMKKVQYVSTHGENSLGGKLVTKKNGTQKLTIASKINGKKIVEIIDNPEQIKEFVDKVLNILDHIWQALVDFFGSVANRFPCQIKMGEKIYTYTEQPARFKGIDKVFYQYNEDKNYEILMFEDTHMSRARRKLRVELKKQGYM